LCNYTKFFILVKKKLSFKQKCAVIGCTNKDIEVRHVTALQQVIHGYFVESIKSKNKSLRGSSKIEPALNRKQIPLCKKCHKDIHSGTYDKNKSPRKAK
jgi:hypothetical protein